VDLNGGPDREVITVKQIGALIAFLGLLLAVLIPLGNALSNKATKADLLKMETRISSQVITKETVSHVNAKNLKQTINLIQANLKKDIFDLRCEFKTGLNRVKEDFTFQLNKNQEDIRREMEISKITMKEDVTELKEDIRDIKTLNREVFDILTRIQVQIEKLKK